MKTRQTKSFDYAVGMFGTSIPINMFRAFAFYFYVEQLSIINAREFANILLAYTFIDVIDNLAYGYLSDRTRTRWGRRRPWIVLGTPVLLLSFIAFFHIEYLPLLSPGNAFWHALVLYTLTGTLDSLVNVNYGAMFPEIFRSEAERSKTNGLRQVFQFLAMIIGLALVPLIAGSLGYGMTALLLAALALAAIYHMAFNSHETKEAQEMEKPDFLKAIKDIALNPKFWLYGLVNASFFSALAILQQTVGLYVRHVLDAPGWVTSVLLGSVILCAMIGVPLWMQVLKKKEAVFTWRASLMVLVMALMPLYFSNSLVMTLIPLVVFGLGYGGASLTMDLIGAKILDEDRRKHNLRREGIFGSFLGILNRLNGLFVAAGFLLAHYVFGYESGDIPGDNPTGAARFLMGLYPLIIMALSFLISFLLRFKKEDSHENSH
ncbi:MAG: MFS transporter [Turicibacter sp.]|nr:MFS transporter [Turicibacter sp.]